MDSSPPGIAPIPMIGERSTAETLHLIAGLIDQAMDQRPAHLAEQALQVTDQLEARSLSLPDAALLDCIITLRRSALLIECHSPCLAVCPVSRIQQQNVCKRIAVKYDLAVCVRDVCPKTIPYEITWNKFKKVFFIRRTVDATLERTDRCCQRVAICNESPNFAA